MRLSRSEQKRRIREVEKLVQELVNLPVQQLSALPVDGEIKSFFLEVPSLKGGARKRQIKYLTKLLKTEPLDDLYEFLSARKGAALVEKKQFHELEYLRDALLDEAINQQRALQAEQEDLEEDWSGETIEEIKRLYPSIDALAVSRLAAIFARTRQPRHSREIFRLLRAAREQAARNNINK